MSSTTCSEELTIIEYIRIINKFSTDILTHAQFKILVEIVLDIGENGKIWHGNKALSEKTATSYNSIRAQLNYLKKKCFINIVKEDGKRCIYLYHPTEHFQLKTVLRTINKTKKLLMVLNTDVKDPLHPLLKDKGKDQIKRKSHLPVGDPYEIHPDLESIWPRIPHKIRRRIRKKTINAWLIANNGHVGYLEYLIAECSAAEFPVLKFQDGLKKKHGKFYKMMGDQASKRKKESVKDLDAMSEYMKERLDTDRPAKNPDVINIREVYDAFMKSDFGCLYANYSMASVIEKESFKTFSSHYAKKTDTKDRQSLTKPTSDSELPN